MDIKFIIFESQGHTSTIEFNKFSFFPQIFENDQ